HGAFNVSGGPYHQQLENGTSSTGITGISVQSQNRNLQAAVVQAALPDVAIEKLASPDYGTAGHLTIGTANWYIVNDTNGDHATVGGQTTGFSDDLSFLNSISAQTGIPTANLHSGSFNTLGATVEEMVIVTNTGNTSLTNLSVANTGSAVFSLGSSTLAAGI